MPTANELYQQAKVAGNVSFQAEWGRTQQQLAKLSAGERVSQLGFSSLEPGEYVMAYDALGQARMRIGHQSDGTVGVIYGNGTPPPVPTAPSVGARQLGVFIGWDGTFAAGYAKPGDFARVDVHMSEEQGFLPNGETIVGTIPQEGGILVGADSVTHYIKLVAVNSSDVPSAPTTEVAVLPLPAGQIAAGAIGAQQFAADIAMLSRLIVGNPTAARLEVDGRVGALVPGMHLYNDSGVETFTLNALTGDVSIRGTLATSSSASGARLEIDGRAGTATPGLRLFDVNNIETLRLNATTGDVSIRGALRTSDAGSRIVVREVANVNDIRFYASSGSSYAQMVSSTTFSGNTAYAGITFNGPVFEGYRSSLGISAFGAALQRRPPSGPGGTSIAAQADYIRFDAGNAALQIRDDAGSPVLGDSASLRFRLIDIDFVAYGDTATWYYANAAGFTTKTSSRASKTEIEDVPFDSEAVIVGAPISMWERRAERDAARARRGVARKRLGPMVEDLPDEVVVDRDTDAPGVSLDAAIAVVWAATGQQSARLDDLASRLAVLEGAT